MTTQYNIVTHGNLINNNGVLSVFSTSNYATLPLEFDPTLSHYGIVFKFNTVDISEEQGVFSLYNAEHYTFPVLNIEIYNSALYFEITSGEVQYNEILGSTILSSSTDYWVKVNRNSDTYTLYLSTNGTTWTTEGTFTTSSHPPLDNYISIIGLYHTNSEGFKCPLMGSIDLNESYIDINDTRWWQGVTSTSDVITRIQLRHDTAANWTSVNPVLLEGEVGLETDTRKQKVGDGSTAWNSLPYDTGSTALQSITSTDVTDALGYTPVNKSGDTMTGSLVNTSDFEGSKYWMKVNGVNKGTNPTSTQYAAWEMVDNKGKDGGTWQAKRISTIEYSLDNSGTARMMIGPYQNTANSSNAASLTLSITSSGDTSCTFPNTTCCDGQWVQKNVDSFADQINLANSSNTAWSKSVSSYLPNDGRNYEILVSGNVVTGNASGNYAPLEIWSDICSLVKVCRAQTRTSATAQAAGAVWLPVGSGRTIYVRRASGWVGDFTIDLRGYRRIGTNN